MTNTKTTTDTVTFSGAACRHAFKEGVGCVFCTECGKRWEESTVWYEPNPVPPWWGQGEFTCNHTSYDRPDFGPEASTTTHCEGRG